MFSLAGHAAFVTGSSQGVGKAIALALASAGSDVVVHGLRKDAAAEATVAECRAQGVKVEFLAGDLTQSHQDITKLVEQAAELHPGIDILVNNAGGYFDVPFLELEAAAFEKTMRLNVVAYFLSTQWFARRWTQAGTRGRVLLIGSINGRLAERTHVAYDTSKGAIEMMVKSLCVELAPHGIRVNGLAPGLFYTPLTAPVLDDARERAWMELHTPNKQVPGPEVIGDAAVFFLSDAAEHIHGQMLLVDGGMSAWQQPPCPASRSSGG